MLCHDLNHWHSHQFTSFSLLLLHCGAQQLVLFYFHKLCSISVFLTRKCLNKFVTKWWKNCPPHLLGVFRLPWEMQHMLICLNHSDISLSIKSWQDDNYVATHEMFKVFAAGFDAHYWSVAWSAVFPTEFQLDSTRYTSGQSFLIKTLLHDSISYNYSNEAGTVGRSQV